MRTYKFRLYPNKDEERRLVFALEMCRLVYNRWLEVYYDGEHDYRMLQSMLPGWRENNEGLKSVYSSVLYYELWRLFSNLMVIDGLKKNGRKVGKLRFKSKFRFRSFTYSQSGFNLQQKSNRWGTLRLSKIGDIPIRLHREIIGDIKCIVVKQMPSGDWYAFLQVEDGKSEDKIMVIKNIVGIDVGLEHYTVDSDGLVIENPRHLRRELKKLRREQRRLSRKKKGSMNYEKQRIIVASVYERAQNQRNDFLHKLSRYYVDTYDFVVTEKLQMKNMVRSHSLAMSIYDAAWYSFNQMLAYKAERAGKIFVQVDPRGTSQKCSGCGEMVPKTLYDREHDCPYCGLSLSRDYNASINILNRGIEKVRSERPELTLVDRRPLQPLASGMHVDWMKQEPSPDGSE